MKNIVLVRDARTGEIVESREFKRDSISYGEEAFLIDKEIKKLRKQYPSRLYEFVRGWADSVEDFLKIFPEYKQGFQRYELN